MNWYRYEVRHYAPPLDEYDDPIPGGGRSELVLMECPVKHETPCGVRLLNGQFVKKTSKKRYACPTKEEALESLRARKRVQVSILKAQLRSAEHDLRLAMTGKPAAEVVELGEWFRCEEGHASA